MFGNRDNKTETPEAVVMPTTISETREAKKRGDNTITAYLGPDTHVEGTLRFDHSVLIEGTFKGKIISKGQLVVGEGAQVDADIESRTVAIKGTVRGTIQASERVQIQGQATVIGDITTASLQMDESVTFEGKCSMGSDANRKAAQQTSERHHERKDQERILSAVESVKS
ncbi:MAG TPA: polymer-forming cytoskeletal protein [Candidatus Krumholzibacteria bacterium]|jgi:cytoskeletal protein CcmA (bactofilin family)